MKQQHAPVYGREILDRWYALAGARLDYLTEMFESGRWRRFHGEAEFLDNIREAKDAVESWRRLACREATADNQAVNQSWLDRPNGVAPYRGSVLHEVPRRAASRVAERAAQVAPLVPEIDWQQALDPEVIQDRYPILRNVL